MENIIITTEPVVHFVSLGYGELRIAKKYATKNILSRLFQTQGGLIMVDPNGDEVFPRKISSLKEGEGKEGVEQSKPTEQTQVEEEEEGEDYIYDLNPSLSYTIVSEMDLLSDTDEDDQDDLDNEDDISYRDEDEDDHDHDHDIIDEEDEVQEQHLQNDEQSKLTTQFNENLNVNSSTTTTTTSNVNSSNNKHCCEGHQHSDEDHNDDKDCCHQQPIESQIKQEHVVDSTSGVFPKLLKMREERIKMISELYKPIHPEIYTLTEDLFDTNFIQAIRDFKATNEKDSSALMKALTKLTETRIYSLRIFSLDFCKKLLEEIDNFRNSGLPTARPNSMNNYGVILDEMGFSGFFEQLRNNYLKYFTALLYPDFNGDKLDSHHAFVVQYKIDKDKELGFHYDESDVTLNLCLGKEFTGGSLYFKGILNDVSTHNEYFEFNHVPGAAIIHIGIHRHGALGLTGGERTNLILWLKNINSNHQNSKAHNH